MSKGEVWESAGTKLRELRKEKGLSIYPMSIDKKLTEEDIKEAFQQTLLLTFSLFFTVKNYTKRDERRTKIFLIEVHL